MNNVIFVSCTDNYPKTFNANNTKIGFLAKGLKELGNEVLIINKCYGKKNKHDVSGETSIGVRYKSFRNSTNFLFTTVKNIYLISRTLKRRYKKECNNILVISCGSFFHYFLIVWYAKCKGYKSALISQEWHVGMNLPFTYKINAYLHNYVLGYMVDYILPISEFLKKKSEHFHKPLFKLPICADYSHIPTRNVKIGKTYFLYCAAAGYLDAIILVLDSFERVVQKRPESNCSLELVLSGTDSNVARIQSMINERKIERYVVIHKQISFEKLLALYDNAVGLLIPLDPVKITDKARFSQKIAEYLSAGVPIITTAVGEIPVYFENYKNAIFCSEFSSASYGALLEYVLDNPEASKEIGLKGRELGKRVFDYKVLASGLNRFLEINSRRNVVEDLGN